MKKLLALAFAALCTAAFGQTKSLPEFMASAGFTQVNDSTWTIADRATVTMQGNYVKAFDAKQNHNWTMTFGNGSNLGTVVKVKSGEKLVFFNGKLTFGDNSTYIPSSFDSQVLLKRSILRSAIFNSARNAMFATDIKVVNPNTISLGTFIQANSTKRYELDAYGNFNSKVATANAELQAKRDQNLTTINQNLQNSQANDYKAMCKKYGQSVIDGVLNGDIIVGAPIDLVSQMMTAKVEGSDFAYVSKIVASNAYTETREFYPGVHTANEIHIHYFISYNKKTQCVTGYYIKKRIY